MLRALLTWTTVAVSLPLAFPLGPMREARARAGRVATGVERDRQARARALFARGRKEFNLGRFKPALRLFMQAYDLVPLSGFLFNIAQCHRFLGDCKKAAFLYRGYLRDNPGSPNSRVVQDLVRQCEHKLQQERLLRGRARKLFQEGVTLYKLGRFAEAVDRYSRAYKIVALPGYLFALGQSHHKLSQYAKAIHFYQMYLRDNPGTPETKSIRGLIEECRQKYTAALRAARGGLAPGTTLGGTARTSGTPPLAPRPVYKRWWFWTAVGVGVAVLVGGLVGGLARPDNKSLSLPQSSNGVLDWR
jgi:tetratricopeptide (TPR) repeat protein